MLDIAPALLRWYYRHRRILPFREDPTPYHIWVSEIMLQQTRVSAVLPYYNRFVQKLPSIPALAACSEDELHKLWEGLGYYSRVRNLQKAAKQVVAEYGGQLPADYDALRSLPGIGQYTAGAIASIAFGLPAVAVDGNVLRVFSRLLADTGDIARPDVKKRLSKAVAAAQPPAAPGDYNQAIMELGALVCLPGAPACHACPLRAQCAGYKKGIAAMLPTTAPKKQKQPFNVCVIVAHTAEGVLLQKRDEGGLLAGLWQPLVLQEGGDALAENAAAKALQTLLPGATLVGELPAAKHIFTHKVWHLYGWQATVPKGVVYPPGVETAAPAQLLKSYTIPAAFKAYLSFMT